MRVLVFGASGVQGFWDTQGGWAARLKRHYDTIQVKNLGGTEQPRVMNLGVSGDTSSELLQRLDTEASARKNAKGLAIIMSIGTNNASIIGGKPCSDEQKYSNQLKLLIDRAKQHTDKIMFVGLHPCNEVKTSPVAWADIVFKNDRIFTFEKTLRKVCEQQNISQVPIFETFAKNLENGKDLISQDGLHLNDDGHQLMADLVRPKLDELLSK